MNKSIHWAITSILCILIGAALLGSQFGPFVGCGVGLIAYGIMPIMK